jgi:hypothetical protein
VIAEYPSRPPYAGVAIEFLSELVTDHPRGSSISAVARTTSRAGRRLVGGALDSSLAHMPNLRDATPQLEAAVAGSGFRMSGRAEVPYARTTASCGERSGSTARSGIEPAGASGRCYRKRAAIRALMNGEKCPA